jgi:hypothetical protein
MGYQISINDSRFVINRKSIEKLCESLKADESELWESLDMASIPDDLETKSNIVLLSDIAQSYRWEFVLNKNEDIVAIEFNGYKQGESEGFFNTIAPYVLDGSYIEISGEDGDLWRWVFTNGVMREIRPTITWEI